MGTSTSSNGPNGGVSFDPPWLDEIEMPGSTTSSDASKENDLGLQDEDIDNTKINIAPPRRFSATRRALNNYAQSGDSDSLRKALGHYSRTGMGGARNVANRMRTSTKSASALFGVLRSAREGNDPEINEWVSTLTSRNASADEILDEIINMVTPFGGSIDEISCRESMAQALENLIINNPQIDLLNLKDNDIWNIIESFLSYEAFNRLCLDIGQSFEKSSLAPKIKVARMNEMHSYLESEIFIQVEKLRESSENFTPNQLNDILQDALSNTFYVYEGAL
ncbi:MAG: hypothetical protein FD141_728 [Fusobacteria bacterium]|nr:MAG: hypothetical protein FD141_728 [Fusobacteriota bacterium]KAF0228606.1 MAG: hypothetical protein FD182_862 [Fusobacteriota bacterium]